ncbi:intermembrane phospholipid transport protein YdbH family protein [Candidatus Phycosocius spiralis]|uniref:intermembrane phospholipid transport protein YdbH family protein n=1 Tax=Candidatus Phycosocius spiralis TaxID=2815099 RepID=UPI0024E0DCC8|nr:YdbH domain-containing protein [Candidatus Phycosocius spiralis]
MAEQAVLAMLRGRGIEGDVSFIKLSVNGAVIENFRLGKAQSPTIVMPKATLSWHISIPSGKLILDHFEARGAQLFLRLDQDGKLDFGALTPFLIQSDQPPQIELGQIRFPEAQLWLETPSGRAVARIHASGGDQQGWRAHILLTPPIQPAGRKTLVLDRPISLGLGFRAGVIQANGSRTPTQIGLSVRPNGQNLTFYGLELIGLRGSGSGLLVLDDKGDIEIHTSTLSFAADRLKWADFNAKSLGIYIKPGLWRHVQNPETGRVQAGYGGFHARIEAQDIKPIADTQSGMPSAKSAQARLYLARSKEGQTRLDVQGIVRSMLGPMSAKMTQLKGHIQAELPDLNAWDVVGWSASVSMIGTHVSLATGPRVNPVSGDAKLDFILKDSGRSFTLNGPLTVGLVSGPRLTIRPDGKYPPVLQKRATPTKDHNSGYEAFGAGDVQIQSPISGKGQARIDAFNWSQTGWSLAARRLVLRDFALQGKWMGSSLSGQINRLNLSAFGNGVPKGGGQGQIQLVARAGAGGLGLGAGRVSLTGQLQGEANRLTMSASGPIAGFAKQGRGVRDGQIKLTAHAKSNGPDWSIDFVTSLGAQAFQSPKISFSDLLGKLSGRIGSDTSGLGKRGWSGQANIDLAIAQWRSNDYDLDQAKLTGPLRLAGKHNSLFGSWDLAMEADELRVRELFGRGLHMTAPMQFKADLSRSGDWRADLKMDAQAKHISVGQSQLTDLDLSGPIKLSSVWDKPLLVGSQECLRLQSQSGTFPGQAHIGQISSLVCPDEQGRLASLERTRSTLFADIQFEPLDLRLGGDGTSTYLKLGAVQADFKPFQKGGWALELSSKDVGFNFKMPDGSLANILAQDSLLSIDPDPNGIVMRGRLSGLRARGLPVQIAGEATTELQLRASGLVGTIAFENLLVRDRPNYVPNPVPSNLSGAIAQPNAEVIETPARFGMLSLTGQGTIQGSQIDIQSDISLATSNAFLARAILNHNTQTGLGRLDAISEVVRLGQAPISRTLSPLTQAGVKQRPLDVNDLIPALKGVVLDAVGEVTGNASMAWGPGQATTSQAEVSTQTLDFATLLGQVRGLSGRLELADLWQVRSAGMQKISVNQFDPGLPISDMNIEFSLPGTNSLDLLDASWSFGVGTMSIRPASWTFKVGDQSFLVDVVGVDLAELLRLTNIPNLKVDAKVSGVLPIEVRNGSVEIIGGLLTAPQGGGKIRYSGLGLIEKSDATSKKIPWYRKLVRIQPKEKPTNPKEPHPTLPQKDIEFEILQIMVDGRITGDLTIAMVLQGANDHILAGVPIKLTLTTKMPLGQIADMADQLLETVNSANMLKEIDKLDRAQHGKGFLPNPLPKISKGPGSISMKVE